MDTGTLTATIIAVGSALIGALVKAVYAQYREHVAWKQREQKALAEIKNPESLISDPREAMEKVLIEDNRKRLRQASGEIKLKLNGDHKPKSEPNGSNGGGAS